MNTRRLPVLYLFASLFLISGAAGLMYEIVWERLLELYFGVTMISITLIVSAYMAGLGIGSLIGGRIAERFPNTLLLYGLLEIGIALFGVVSAKIIVWIGESTAGSSYVLVFLISFLVLLIPTTLMGMTLPLLTQSFVHRVEGSGEVIGLLYGINTLGAALGALLAGYVLIGFYAFEGAIYIAVLLNAAVGVCAFVLARWQFVLAADAARPMQMTAAIESSWGYRTILFSSFLVGFLGLGFEILWIRILLLVNKSTAYSFPSILFIFLLGLALGGYLWGRRADSSRDPIALFCKLEVGGAVVAALTFLFFAWSLAFQPPWVTDFFQTQKPLLPFVEVDREIFFSRRALLKNLWDYFLPILILVLPASLILGGGLTVLDRLSIHHPAVSGRRVGDIHLANIVGSVAGSLTISFVLLPLIGSEWTIRVLVFSTLLFPVFYFMNRPQTKTTSATSLLIFCSMALVAVILLPQGGQFYRALYAAGTGLTPVVSESGDSVLALTLEPGAERQRGYFWIGGEINSLIPAQGTYEERALVCAGASRPKRILVIGFGGGYSALFYKSIPDVNEIVVVELLGDIAPFLSRHVESARMTLEDPRLTYQVDDGRRYLNAHPEEKFDLISIDPLRQHTSGHNNLYSIEALEIYQRHLTAKGVLCAWMDNFHVIPHTVAQVFPYVDQFRNEFMVASNQRIGYDRPYMDQAVQHYAALTQELYGAERRITLNVSRALEFFVRNQDGILGQEQGIEVLHDMNPLLEYFLFRWPTAQRLETSADAAADFQSRIEE